MRLLHLIALKRKANGTDVLYEFSLTVQKALFKYFYPISFFHIVSTLSKMLYI